jgi:hypothetical protein
MTPLELALSSVPPVALASLSFALRRSVRVGLQQQGARARDVRVNRLIQVVAVPASFLVEWLAPSPLSTILLAAVCFVYGAAIAPGVLVWMGERQSRRVRSAEPSSALREIWEKLEALATSGASPLEKAARYEALTSTLLGPWEGPVTAIASALLRQSRVWVFPPDHWSLEIAEGEIELYRQALELWPGDPPRAQNGVLPAPTLWGMFNAYVAYAATWRAEYTGEELDRRRAALAVVRGYDCPETRRFIDTLTQLFLVGSGEADATQEEVYELADAAQTQMDTLFPSVWALRGAHVGR